MSKLHRLLLLLAIFLVGTIGSYSQTVTLVSPANGTGCLTAPIQFTWTTPSTSTISGTVTYNLQISTSPTFTTPLESQTSSTSTTILLLNADTQYWWRVGTIFSSNTTTTFYGGTSSFTTNRQAPSPIAPNSTTCSNLTNTFSWTSVLGATSYILQYSDNAAFSGTTTVSTSFTSTTASISVPRSFQTYFWRVSALTPTCNTGFGAASSFTTKVGAPVLATPANGAGGFLNSVDLSWATSPGADLYEIQLSTNSSFPSTTATSTFTNPSTTLTAAQVFGFNTTYFWRVRAWITASACISDWSNSNSFRTSYDAAVLNTPLQGTTCYSLSSASFDWSDVSGASGYELNVATNPSFQNNVIEYSNTFSTSQAAIALSNASSSYFWRARARDLGNTGQWSPTRFFETTSFPNSLGSPTFNATGVPVTAVFNWTPQGSVSFYTFEVATDSLFANKLTSTTISGSTNSRTVTLPDYNRRYFWRMRQHAFGCQSDWTGVRPFNTVVGFPTLLEPANGALNQPLRTFLRWSAVPTASTYDIEISKSLATFTPIAAISFNLVPNTNVTLLNGTEANTTYYWRVRTRETSGGISPWSPIWSFRTGSQGAEIPSLLFPSTDAKKVQIDTDLRWKKSARAVSYKVQVARDANFANIVKDSSAVIDTTLKLNNLQYFTPHYWRVAAVNDSGTTRYSEVRMFRSIAFPPTDTVILVKPAADTTNYPILNAYFDWNIIPRTEQLNSLTEQNGGYEINISTNNAFSGTLTKNVRTIYANETVQNDFNFNTEYFWRVRGWNEAGDGPWSRVRKFRTTTNASVSFEEYDFSAKFSPIPVNSDAASLQFNLPNDGNARITIINEAGVTVAIVKDGASSQGMNYLNINTKNLSSGVYFFNIEFDGKFQVGKFVVNK